MPGRRKKWVVKAGSNLVCSGGPLVVLAWMQQVAALRRDFGIEVIWVTSGAISTARDRGQRRGVEALAQKQALSAIGQPLVMDMYNQALFQVGLSGAQVLLTAGDLGDAPRRKNLVTTLKQLLRWGVVPVLNENDAVATEEIKFGDNDALSAKVAVAMKADRLVILTDVEGFYDSDPRTDEGARLVKRLPEVTPEILASVSAESGSGKGKGGMYSKLSAASLANEQGISAWLARGDLRDVLVSIARDDEVGTRIGTKSNAS